LHLRSLELPPAYSINGSFYLVAGVPPIMGVPYADALIKVLGLGALSAKFTEFI